ncbi:MAG TPA: metallophosphoesterase, partial [Flavobacteriales bacterium]|nr:metallophosphoesterase [Flavobacteriales bacterium]
MRNTALTITLLASMTIYDVAAQTPIITRGPYLNLGTSSSVVVRWRTDISSDTKVWYGTQLDIATMVSVIDASATTEHELNITGLQTGTRYFYA